MRLGSLCTGYGGLDMGVAAHYATTPAWCSDNDPDCAQVLDARLPGVPNLGDLTTVDWDQVEPVDIVCAGFPCQPFSFAGKREGTNDERAIFAYIADGISVLRPGIVVLENVAAITSLGGPGVVGTLTGLGYDLRWGLVRAADAGAPHRRARWFCVATDAESAERRTEEHETVDATVGSATEPRERSSATSWGCYHPAIRRWERTIGRPAPDPTDDGKLSSRFVEWMMGLPEDHICGLGLPRTAELRMLGNGVVPAQAKLALELLGV